MIVDTEDKIRADLFIANRLSISRSQAQKVIKEYQIQKILYPGDIINIEYQSKTNLIPEKENLNLEIIYEDNDMIIVNKAHGVVVHPSGGHQSSTLVNGLIYHCPSLSKLNNAGLVHRLDKDTAGIILVAKSHAVHEFLSNQFQNRTVVKVYDAIVYNKIIPYRKIETFLKRNNKHIVVANTGRFALTEVFLQNHGTITSHIKCRIYTGRTHQIRVHMQYINHSIVGDAIYNHRQHIKSDIMCLHASYIEFQHPNGERMNFKSDPKFLHMLI